MAVVFIVDLPCMNTSGATIACAQFLGGVPIPLKAETIVPARAKLSWISCVIHSKYVGEPVNHPTRGRAAWRTQNDFQACRAQGFNRAVQPCKVKGFRRRFDAAPREFAGANSSNTNLKHACRITTHISSGQRSG